MKALHKPIFHCDLKHFFAVFFKDPIHHKITGESRGFGLRVDVKEHAAPIHSYFFLGGGAQKAEEVRFRGLAQFYFLNLGRGYFRPLGGAQGVIATPQHKQSTKKENQSPLHFIPYFPILFLHHYIHPRKYYQIKIDGFVKSREKRLSLQET
jgi:hypothetical protein